VLALARGMAAVGYGIERRAQIDRGFHWYQFLIATSGARRGELSSTHGAAPGKLATRSMLAAQAAVFVTLSTVFRAHRRRQESRRPPRPGAHAARRRGGA